MTARKKPVSTTVVTAERKIPAETLRFTPAVSPAPYRWAVRIVKPEVSPWAKPVIRNMMIPVEPHGRQGSGSHIPAHDDRIGHIIKLLEKISQQKRYRKPQKDRQGPSLCHIRSHMTPRFLLISRFILAHPQKGCKWIFRRFTGRA